MLSAYIVCFLAGGVVLGASMFGGHDSGGGDAHLDDAHVGPIHDGHHEWAARLPFLSLRFWTWGVTFFGLAGLALTLGGTPAPLVPVLAAASGLASGWGASWALGRLSRDAVGLLPEASSHIGREGKLLLPLRRGQRSKIRLSIGGVETDLLAETDLETEIPAPSTVLVVGMRGLTAVVEPTPAALRSLSGDNQDSGKEES
jgi:membrane protein implicated in regulation of membrane protease activity